MNRISGLGVLCAVLVISCATIALRLHVPAPFPVVEASFIQTQVPGLSAHPFSVWIAPNQSQSKVVLGNRAETIYYAKMASNTWSSFTQLSDQKTWTRTIVTASHVTTMFDLGAVRQAFARLRSHAVIGTVSEVAVGGRAATYFVTTTLPWPYLYTGLAAVWLDTGTGLPVQFRTRQYRGDRLSGTYITKVLSIRQISSATLARGFFDVPLHRSIPWWERLVGQL